MWQESLKLACDELVAAAFIAIASASSPRQGSNAYNPREELLALGRDLESLHIAINAARGRLDALRTVWMRLKKLTETLGIASALWLQWHLQSGDILWRDDCLPTSGLAAPT